jgi:hypothetical protein
MMHTERLLMNVKPVIVTFLGRPNIFLQKHGSRSTEDLISFAEYLVETTDRSKGTKKAA